MEIWRDVIGYENKYLVSNYGSVKSIQGKRKRVLKPFLRSGYPVVRLGNGEGVIKNKYVHRLVAEAFIGELPGDLCVNHKDGNRQNSVVGNLEIITQRENNIHSCYVLGNNMVPVTMLDKLTGEELQRFISIKEAAKVTGINLGDISSVCSGKRKSAGGYVWARI